MVGSRHCAVGVVGLALALAGCGGDSVDPTPEKLDGSESAEFEPDDIDHAEDADDAVKDYCADAVSEAQRIGCESHVEPGDIP